MNTLHVQFIGYGNMGSAIGEMVKQTADIIHQTMHLSIDEKNDSQKDRHADIVFVCVKPQQINDVDLDLYRSDSVCVSIMNGIATDKLSHFSSIIRTMPNLLSEVGTGVTGWYQKGNIDHTIKTFVEQTFLQSGIIIQLTQEDDFSLFTAFA